MLSIDIPGHSGATDSEYTTMDHRHRQGEYDHHGGKGVFCQTCYRDMAKKFTDEQLKEFREAFLLFDKDRDGVITNRELFTVLRSLGQDPTSEEIAGMLDSLDCNRSGSIDFTEFLHMMARIVSEADSEGEVIEVFRVLDQDGDGFISKSDIREVIFRTGFKLTHQEIDEMFDEVDKDGDGQVDYEEFVKIITARH